MRRVPFTITLLLTILFLVSLSCNLPFTQPSAPPEASETPDFWATLTAFPSQTPLSPQFTATSESPPTVTPSASPIPPTSTTLPSPTTFAYIEAEVYRIQFPSGGTSAEIDETLAVNGIDRYVLGALGGQTMTVEVWTDHDNLLLSIAGEDGSVLKSSGVGTPYWSGVLPATQDYYIAIFTADGSIADYTLYVNIPPIAASTSESVTRIRFETGATSDTRESHLGKNETEVYVLRALGGQTMTVDTVADEGKLKLSVTGADGKSLKSFSEGGGDWSGLLPKTQDYYLRIKSETGISTDYTLEVIIPPLAQSQPTRIRFKTGTTGATVTGSLAKNETDVYILRALAGQTMKVNAWSPQEDLLVQITGADGKVLKKYSEGTSDWSVKLPKNQDYLIYIRSENGDPADYTLEIKIPPL